MADTPNRIRNLTIDDVAERYKCTRDHVWRLVDDGVLTGGNIARKDAKRRCMRFSEFDLQEYDKRSSDGVAHRELQESPEIKTPRRQRSSARRFNYVTNQFED